MLMQIDATAFSDLKAALLDASDYRGTTRAHHLLEDLIAKHGIEALPILKRAAKGSKKRELVLASLFLERGDAGCAVSDTAVREIIANKTHIARDAVLGSMQHSTQKRFAPVLREIAKDVTDIGWPYAVAALGEWPDIDTVDVLISHTKGLDTAFVVLQALVKMCVPEAVAVFEANLKHPEPRTRTFALWGLAKLGSEQAIGTLIALLDDQDISNVSGFTPGQAMRAAQAIADVLHVPFSWGDEKEIEKMRDLCKGLFSASDITRLCSQISAGQITFNRKRKTP
jgi:hypothetical protein